MLHSKSKADLGRSTVFALLLFLMAMGTTLWWLGSKESVAPASTPDSEKHGAPAIEQSTPLNELESNAAAARIPGEEPIVDIAVPVETGGVLRGTIIPDRDLPSDETLEILVEGWNKKTDGQDWSEFMPGMRKWQEVARVSPDAAGRFEAPRPAGFDEVRLRVLGDYVAWGQYDYKVNGKDDPKESQFEVRAVIGAHVTLNLVLDESATDAELLALEGDSFHLQSLGPSTRGGFAGSPHQVSGVVDSKGRVVLPRLHAWPWAIELNHGDSKHQDLAPFRVKHGFDFEPEPGTRVIIDVPMVRGQLLEGQVVDSQGAAISGSEVTVKWHWSYPGGSGGSWAQRRTGEEGKLRFQALPAEGLHGLEISAYGYFTKILGEEDLAQLLQGGNPHRFQLEKGRVLRVVVADERGLPAHGFPVQIQIEGGGDTLGRVRTDEQGSAEFVGLPTGNLQVRGLGRRRKDLQKQGEQLTRYLPHETLRLGPMKQSDPEVETLWCLQAPIPSGQIESGDALKLVVQPVATVHGAILGMDPSWSDSVRLIITQPDPNIPSFAQERMMMSGPGTFAVDAQTGQFSGPLAPGNYTAIAVAGSASRGRMRPGQKGTHTSKKVQFEMGTEDIHIQVPFAQEAQIEGSVVLSDGTGLEGVTVALSRQEEWFASAIGSTQTDAKGTFRFEAQPPGTYLFRLVADQYMLGESVSLTIRDGEPVTPVRLQAVQGGAIRVHLTGVDGATKTPESVGFAGKDGRRVWARVIEGESDWAGAHGPMAPGEYVVSIPQELGKEQYLLHRKALRVHPGQIAEVSLSESDQSQATITGKATAGGNPVQDLVVWLRDSRGKVAIGATNRSGEYMLHSMATGSMWLACGPGPGTEVAAQQVSISAGQNVLLPMDLPTGGVDGHLTGNSMVDHPVVFRVGSEEPNKPFRRSGGTSNGNFHIPYLPDGIYEVTTVGRDGVRSPHMTVQRVEVTGGNVVRGVKVEPIPEGR